jgi:uncharacterized phiE125 gp8 family phage protein
MKFKIVTPISSEPITLSEARKHLRIEPYGSPEEHPDDGYVTTLISIAREWCEKYLERALGTQVIQISVDNFNSTIKLPNEPIQSVDTITYVDTNGDTQTLSTSVYELDEYDYVIRLKYGQVYPAVRPQNDAVTITYTAGYTNGVSPDTYPFPFSIKAAMLLIIGNLYENRQQDVLGNTRISLNSLPMGVYALLQPYRLGLGM